jgi:hypothetical protein
MTDLYRILEALGGTLIAGMLLWIFKFGGLFRMVSDLKEYCMTLREEFEKHKEIALTEHDCNVCKINLSGKLDIYQADIVRVAEQAKADTKAAAEALEKTTAIQFTSIDKRLDFVVQNQTKVIEGLARVTAAVEEHHRASLREKK